jgi:hypothetical protein
MIGRMLKFFFIYILLGPITITLYIIKWLFKG